MRNWCRGLFPAKRRALWLLSAALCLNLAGCGNSGSGPGLVLRALGFFAEPGDKETAPTAASKVVDSGRSVPFSTTNSIPNDPDNDGGEGLGDGGYLALENAQGTAGITTDGAQLVYTIQNSSFQVPNDSFPFSVRLEPAGDSASNEVFVQIQLVSPQTMSFMQSHSSSLPPPPFTMVVTVTVTGRSDAGVTYQSNPINYNITFTD